MNEEELKKVSGGADEDGYDAKLIYPSNGMYRNNDKWIYKYDLCAGTRLKLTGNSAEFYGLYYEAYPEGKTDPVYLPAASIELI